MRFAIPLKATFTHDGKYKAVAFMHYANTSNLPEGLS